MDRQEIKDFLLSILDKNNIVAYGNIPDIDLYMDQLTTFIEDRLSGYKRAKADKILTKTMINNYTKDGILPPPEKKKYNREQIALLIIIYHLKAGLSINDISLIFDVVEEHKIGVERFYKEFTGIQAKELKEIKAKLNTENELPNGLENNSNDEPMIMLSLILSLIAESNLKKQIAERLIDKLASKIKTDK